MNNPNQYDDEKFAEFSVKLDTAIGGLWEAGASLRDIEEVIRNGLENAGVQDPDVEIAQ